MKNEEKGLILIELITAMAIFSLGMAGIFILFVGGTKGGIKSLERTNSHLLSTETWEASLSLEKKDSSLFTPGNYEIGINNNEWILIPKGGLVGHFLLSNDITDESIYENEATMNNVDFGKDRKEQLFNAAKFNGINSNIRVFSDQSLQLTGPLTISAWVISTEENGIIAGKYNENTQTGSYVLSKENNFYVFKVFGTQGYDTISTEIIDENTWNHVLGVFDPAEPRIRIYINGELKNSKITSINLLDPASSIKFTIGADSANNNVWNGSISDVRIYNYSLTSAHIAGLYEKYSTKKEKKLKISTIKQLIASWHFDEGEGCIIHDNTENCNHGYIRNCQADLWTLSRFEKENKAYSFNQNNFLEIMDSNSLQIEDEISISLWVKLPESLPEQTMVLLHKRATGTNDYSFALSYNKAEKAYEWAISKGQENNLTSVKALNVAVKEKWQHLLLTYNNIDRKIYINDVEIINTTPSSFSNAGDNSNLYIGQKANQSNKFAGIIDDLRIYNKILNNKEKLEIFLNDNNFFLK